MFPGGPCGDVTRYWQFSGKQTRTRLADSPTDLFPSQPKRATALSFKPVNAGLQTVFDVLRCETLLDPSRMGANVANYGEVLARLGPFIRQFRRRQRGLGLLTNDATVAGKSATGTAPTPTSNVTPVTPTGPTNGQTQTSAVTPNVVAGPAPCVERPCIVACDVKGAFDSIPLVALEKIATELVAATEYDVRRVTRVTGGVVGGFRTKTQREATRVKSAYNEVDGGVSSRVTTLRNEGDETAARTGTRALHKTNPNRHVSSSGVAIDQASPSRVHATRVLELLREHLRRNVVRSGGVYLLQKVGIPQGSVLSTLLCAVFYAHLERHHGLVPKVGAGNDERNLAGGGENDTPKNKNVLCRWTDDLLFCSTSQPEATAFLQLATDAFAAYGCLLNPAKTKLSFDPLAGGGGAFQNCAKTNTNAKKQIGVKNKTVPWCGLLLDCVNLEVTADFTRYAGDFVREAVTTSGRAGAGSAVGHPFRDLGTAGRRGFPKSQIPTHRLPRRA
jgi:telomerase reverse transcriptase